MPQPTITRTGNTVVISDGRRSSQSVCASPGAAKSLATRLKNDPAMVARWLRHVPPVQLDLPLAVQPTDQG